MKNCSTGCFRPLSVAAILAVAGGFGSMAHGQVILRESQSGLGVGGVQGNGDSTYAQISTDGVNIVFRSRSTNWSDGSSGEGGTRAIKRSRAGGGLFMLNSGLAASPPLSGNRPQGGDTADLTFRGGSTYWSNSVDINFGGFDPCPDTNGVSDIFGGGSPVSALTTGGPCGTQSNGSSFHPAVFPEGVLLAFDTAGTIFSSGDTATRDVYTLTIGSPRNFAKKSITGNIISGITAGNNTSEKPAVGGNANLGYVTAFESLATNLVTGDTNGVRDIFVRVDPDTSGPFILLPFTSRISVSTAGTQANGASFNPSVSHNGNVVAFASDATNLVGGDTNGVRDVFVRNRNDGTTFRISHSFSGLQADAASDNPVVSNDGTWVAFESLATNLLPNATTTVGVRHVYLCHVPTNSIFICDFDYVNWAFAQSDSFRPTITDNGLVVAFDTQAANLGITDTNTDSDVYSYTRSALPANDNCVFATVISGATGSTSGTLAGALPSPNLPLICGSSSFSPDVWYRFTPVCSGSYTFDTLGSAADTTLSILADCNGPVIVCNDDAVALTSSVTTNLVADQAYLVRVSSFQVRTGAYNLNWARAASTPANDLCANAQAIGLGQFPFSNCGATNSAFIIANCNLTGNADVWYSFTAQTAGSYAINACQSNFNSVLAVYAGAGCPSDATTQIACNDDTCALGARVNFVASAGQQFKVRLAGFGGAQGAGVLVVTKLGCSPADIANDQGDPLPGLPNVPNNGVNEGDYNAFFNGFFTQAPYCNIADDQGTPFPPFGNPIGADNGVNEGDYNCFFNFFFNGCP
ncbi:hypothetical protein BH11PLA1_BH11PLA1_21760 [soil metagenome]